MLAGNRIEESLLVIVGYGAAVCFVTSLFIWPVVWFSWLLTALWRGLRGDTNTAAQTYISEDSAGVDT